MKRNGQRQTKLVRVQDVQAPGPSLTSSFADRQLNTRTLLVYSTGCPACDSEYLYTLRGTLNDARLQMLLGLTRGHLYSTVQYLDNWGSACRGVGVGL